MVYKSGWWLSHAFWKMMKWVTVGMIKNSQYDGKMVKNVPNHQPVKDSSCHIKQLTSTYNLVARATLRKLVNDWVMINVVKPTKKTISYTIGLSPAKEAGLLSENPHWSSTAVVYVTSQIYVLKGLRVRHQVLAQLKDMVSTSHVPQ